MARDIYTADSIVEDLSDGESVIVLIIAIGVAPNPTLGMERNTAAEDMEKIYRFYFEKLKKEKVLTVVYAIDASWDNRDIWFDRQQILESIYNPVDADDNLLIYPILDKLPYKDAETICKDYELQRETHALGSLEALGKTCSIESGSIWEKLANAARSVSKVYIYNAAWFTQRGLCNLTKNKLFENTCELAAVANVNKDTFILTSGPTYDAFQTKEQVLRSTVILNRTVYGELYITPMPGTFNRDLRYLTAEQVSEKVRKADEITGGRKRTRKGLKKRRATRRWKRRS